MLYIPSTAHLLDGAVIGADRSDGVIDANLRVFDYHNMLVCDGSAMPAVRFDDQLVKRLGVQELICRGSELVVVLEYAAVPGVGVDDQFRTADPSV
ncbi:GMC oxidoreductase [Mycobacteroides abscessus]|uniref:GMC oxidoreductase n=1 Tax=Mycobacteroides abscessus TaxID=36809 RepID=UPI0027DF1CB0|nr:GMC oxidoreductase [Mycobacteroides abscessus]